MNRGDHWQIRFLRSDELDGSPQQLLNNDNEHVVIIERQTGQSLGLLGERMPFDAERLADGAYWFYSVPIGGQILLDQQLKMKDGDGLFRVSGSIRFQVTDPTAVAVSCQKAQKNQRDWESHPYRLVEKQVERFFEYHQTRHAYDVLPQLASDFEQGLLKLQPSMSIIISDVCKLQIDVLQPPTQVTPQILSRSTGNTDRLRPIDLDAQSRARLQQMQAQDEQRQLDIYAEMLSDAQFDQLASLLVSNAAKIVTVINYFESIPYARTQKEWNAFKQWIYNDQSPLIAVRLQQDIRRSSTDLVVQHSATQGYPNPPLLAADRADDWLEIVEVFPEDVEATSIPSTNRTSSAPSKNTPQPPWLGPESQSGENQQMPSNALIQRADADNDAAAKKVSAVEATAAEDASPQLSGSDDATAPGVAATAESPHNREHD